jgi:hypothetical protein
MKIEIENIVTFMGEINFFKNGWCVIGKLRGDGSRGIRSLFFVNLKNDEDESDTDIFEVIGNIYETPELLYEN